MLSAINTACSSEETEGHASGACGTRQHLSWITGKKVAVGSCSYYPCNLLQTHRYWCWRVHPFRPPSPFERRDPIRSWVLFVINMLALYKSAERSKIKSVDTFRAEGKDLGSQPTMAANATTEGEVMSRVTWFGEVGGGGTDAPATWCPRGSGI